MRIEDDNGISELLDRRGNKTLRRLRLHRGSNLDRCGQRAGLQRHPRQPPAHLAPRRLRGRRSTASPRAGRTGLTLDDDGNVLACEHGGRRVSSAPYGSPGSETSLADTWDGKQLNSPNDLVVHSSGAIFFTDPNLRDGLRTHSALRPGRAVAGTRFPRRLPDRSPTARSALRRAERVLQPQRTCSDARTNPSSTSATPRKG